MLALVRSNDVDIALFVHVLGAMVLVGGLLTAATAGLVGWNDETARLRRFSYMTLLCVALPGWIVMRVGAEWVYEKESYDKLPSDPTWLGIGFSVADIGGLLLLIALIVGAIGYWRRTDRMLKAASVISVLLVAAYIVAVWAMGAKPS
jgi:UDP-N-acetylmuramyl pentapeptide phosphotransferase/UDP-N-acetylglucosamine-1-phosphate transferase